MTEVTNKMLPLLIALDPELFNQLRPEAQQSEAAQKGYQMATCTEAMAEWLRTETDTEALHLYLSNTNEWLNQHTLAIALGLNDLYIQNAKEFVSDAGYYSNDIPWMLALAKRGLFNDCAFVSKIIDAWHPALFSYMYMANDVCSYLEKKASPLLNNIPLLVKALNNKIDITHSYEIIQVVLKNPEAYAAAILNGILKYDVRYISFAKRKEITQADLFLDIAYGLNKNKDDKKLTEYKKNLQYCTERFKNRYQPLIIYALKYTDNLDWAQWLKVKKLFKRTTPEHALLNTPEDVHAWVQSKLMSKVEAVALPDITADMF